MLAQKVIRLRPADLMSAFEEIGLQIPRGAQNVPCAARFMNGLLYRLNRENVVARAVFDQQRARRDQRREIAQLAELQYAGDEIADAVIDRQDAVPPVAEI